MNVINEINIKNLIFFLVYKRHVLWGHFTGDGVCNARKSEVGSLHNAQIFSSHFI
jgi:hypothetical protein